MNINKSPEMTWRMTPFQGHDFALHFIQPPCWFWRFMSSKILGFKWEKL